VSNPPTRFDTYSLVLLVTPPDPPQLDDDAAAELQRAHLGHLTALGEAGHLLVAGPLSDQPDERLRGICLFRVGLDEARQLMEQDPAVQAGRLAVETMTWWTMEGALAFPLTPKP
jgi:uncharacterized protein YciI